MSNDPTPSNPSRDTLPTRVLRLLADGVCRYPRLFFYPQVVLFIICVGYTVYNLKLNTSRDDLVGSDKKYHQNFLKFRREFPRQDDIVAVVESEDVERNRQFVERLGRRLSAETKLFVDVMYNNDLKMLGNKALLFFPEKDLVDFQKTLADYQPFLRNFAQATNLDSLFRLINLRFRTARPEQNSENEALLKAFPALERIVTQATDSLRRSGTPPSPGIAALISPDAGREAIRQQYITFDKERLFVVTAHAVNGDLNGDAVERMRRLVEQTQAEVPGVNVAITGEPVLEYDEMHQSERDSTKATILSLIIVAIIFIFGYHSTGRPIKANVCLIIGLGYTMGYTTLVVGHLNILTITFVPMLIGMAIDFGVHLITRYEEELRHGRTERVAIEKAIVNTGQGIFTGCFTTAGAFFAMSLTNFKGIQEMGLITGGGMLICLIPMMTMLPVLLLRGRQNVLDHHPPPELDGRARIERLWLERPRTVIAVTLGLCAICLAGFPRVYFDYNLLNMQTAGIPAVVFEKKLIDTADKSVLYAAVVAESLDQAVALEAKLTNLVSVAGVDSMSRFLREDQTRKLALVSQIKNQIREIQFAPLDTGLANPKAFSQTLDILTSYLGKAMEEIAKEKDADQNLLSQLRSLRVSVKELSARVANGQPAVISVKLAAYQQALFQDIQDTFATIRNQDDSGPLREADLPAALRHRFVGVTGKHLLQVNPKQDVWQRDKQEEFVREVRTIDPEVTGTPVQLYEYTTLLKDSYVQAAWYALGAIAILVFLHFRSLTSVVLSLLPVAIGTIWMVGFMAYTGIPFNPANIMTLPLVIGIGVTNGIHILNRFAEEKNPGILAKSTGKAVLVSALTTVAGFGSLIMAKHQGIASLGYVMAVGTATCMIAGLTFLPALLNLMSGGLKGEKSGGDGKESKPAEH